MSDCQRRIAPSSRAAGRFVVVIAADEAMGPERPGFARPHDRRALGAAPGLRPGVTAPPRSIGRPEGRPSRDGLSTAATAPSVDFADLETGRREGEIEVEAHQRLELLPEALAVPGRELREPVVGDHEGAASALGEMVERDRRNFGKAEAPRREDAPVAGDDPAVGVDQDGHVEAEGFDAVGDAADLPGGMKAGVARIGRQSVDWPPADRDPRLRACRFRLALDVCLHVGSCVASRVRIAPIGRLAMFCS